jgi:hypothetical protein
MAKKQIEGEVREFVDKAEFERFRNEQEKIQNKMLALLEKSVEPAVTVSPVLKGEVPKEAVTDEEKLIKYGFKGLELTPEQQQVLNNNFNPADKFRAKLDVLTFHVLVPESLTNNDNAYMKMYKIDLRSKVLPAHDLLGAMDKRCKEIVKNLHYDYNKTLKRN